MDGAITLRGALAQAVQVLQRTAMNLGAHFLQRLGIGVGAGKTKNFVAARDQFPGCGRADKSGRAGDEYAHESTPCSDGQDIATLRMRVK